jgi:hypothetical protein
MVVAEAAMGITAFKAMMDITKGIKDIDDRTRRNEAVIELQEKILGAQAAQSTLVDHVSELEKELATLKAWDADKKRYKLTALQPGVVAYSLKEGMEDGEPVHQLCASCFNDNHKSFLQSQFWQPMRAEVLVCHDCGSVLYISGQPHPDHKTFRPPAYRPTS